MLLWGPKGGSGVTVTAAALATVLARRGPSRIVDLGGDLPAALGLAVHPTSGVADWLRAGPEAPVDGLHRLGVEAARGLVLLGRGGGEFEPGDASRLLSALSVPDLPTVIDAGAIPCTAPDFLVGLAAGATSIAVLRPCFLALRRAVEHPLLPRCAGVILVAEPGRALRSADVTRVLERPVLAEARAEAGVARAVDAGILGARLPAGLERTAHRVLAAVERTGRAS